MHNARLILVCLATAAIIVWGQNIDDDDIPQECRSICSPVIQLSQQCEQQFGSNDNNYNYNDNNFGNCICNSQNANINIPTCDACVSQYQNYYTNNNDNDGYQNEVNQWLQNCNFPTTTLPPGYSASQYYGTPYGTQTSCYTATFTGYNNINNNINNGQYVSTSVYCGYGGYSTGGYYGYYGGSPTSWSKTTFTSTYNNGNGYQATITSTALVGTATNGNVLTTPISATSYLYTGGVGPIATALPFAGAGAGFLMLAFAI